MVHWWLISSTRFLEVQRLELLDFLLDIFGCHVCSWYSSHWFWVAALGYVDLWRCGLMGSVILWYPLVSMGIQVPKIHGFHLFPGSVEVVPCPTRKGPTRSELTGYLLLRPVVVSAIWKRFLLVSPLSFLLQYEHFTTSHAWSLPSLFILLFPFFHGRF